MNADERFFQRQREIGPAIWLLALYWAMQDAVDEYSWGRVADGSPILDKHAASFLKISAHTAEKWRKRLYRAEVISMSRKGRGFVISAYRPPFANRFLERINAVPPEPLMQTAMVQ